MNTESRHLTDQELEFSLQNQITVDKQQRLIEESNILELRKKFNLTYVSYSYNYVSVESENFSANIGSYQMKAEDRMKCKIDMKDISTYEDFQAVQDNMKAEKQKTLTALFWIAFRVFQEKGQ